MVQHKFFDKMRKSCATTPKSEPCIQSVGHFLPKIKSNGQSNAKCILKTIVAEICVELTVHPFFFGVVFKSVFKTKEKAATI